MPATQTKRLTAKQFVTELKTLQSDTERIKIQRYFREEERGAKEADQFMGVKMGSLFNLAKNYVHMPIAEIEKLLESPVHEIRAGAVSIMDKAARDKTLSAERRKSIFDLYMNRHDRINNWDLVDLGCLDMVGHYLIDKPRKILYKLARSKDRWERRTAILGTCYFIKQGEVDDTFKIAEILVHDPEDLVNKGTGWMLRFAGDKDKKKLLVFLDQYADTMPRVLLRYTIEKLTKQQREKYMKAGKGKA